MFMCVESVSSISGATAQKHYFGHDAAVDQYGVIAPWYKGQNGQFDLRVGVAAETMKRYPWAGLDRAVLPAPDYVYDGTWQIDPDGKITVVPERDWANGDLGQRAAYILGSMINYYAYSGDPAAFAIISSTANYLTQDCETSSSHAWPAFLISVPNMGIRYGDCRLGPNDDLQSSNGKIQLDIVAEAGLQLTRAYEMTGNKSWYNAAKHWADLLAVNRRRAPGIAPWGRYADNADQNGMNGIQTGGVAFILDFFEELIHTGYTGQNNSIIAARDAAREYLRDTLLPRWYVNDTWGRNYWDWEDPVQAENVTEFVVNYLIRHRHEFPHWRTEARNILSLFLNHTSVSPKSNGDTYNGAWAYPESSACCGRSLSYPAMELGSTFARYGVEAHSEWAKEIGRRSETLVTYDGLENGQVMDDIDGGSLVDRSWFKIAQPTALYYVLKAMGWLPAIMGANRENHLMRSTSVVRRVVYGKGKIIYSTSDAPSETIEVLRLSFAPDLVIASGWRLPLRSDLGANGYTERLLPGGDFIVSIRHDGATQVEIDGPDPQSEVDDGQLQFTGQWNVLEGVQSFGGEARVSDAAEGAMTYTFSGNQVRLIGEATPSGGLARVYLDGTLQLVPIDCYSPVPVYQQILYYRNGLSNGSHRLKILVEGTHRPLSSGNNVYIDALQYSSATGNSGFGSGGGPTDYQRFIFGYTGSTDYIDSQGRAWRPGTEFIARTGDLTDSVAKTWWTMRQAVFVKGTPDPELYRYGVHWPDFTVNLTAGPSLYHVRLKFAENQYSAPNQRGITIFINGQKVVEDFDVFATAGEPHKAVDLVFNNIKPQNGVIAIRFVGSKITGSERDAMVQAIEIGSGNGGAGSIPKKIAGPLSGENP
jgi:hypothetical protein